MSLQQKILETIEQIRNNPLNHNLRLQLLQYYCIAGQWQQAQKTLHQYLKLNSSDQQTRALFLGNIECEIQRLNVFDKHSSVVPYTATHNPILIQEKILQQLQHSEHLNTIFLELHNQVQPNFSIRLNDQSELKDQFIDTDIRLSHVFEIFEESRYTWLGLDEIREVHFKPTEILTDLIWRRTEIILKSNNSIACFVPVRYPFQPEAQLDEALLYARSTVWENAGDFATAIGQKTYSNNELDIGILDIADIYSI